MTETEKGLLVSLSAKEEKFYKGESGESVTLMTEEEALKEKLHRTLNGNIAYFAYHGYILCPQIIIDQNSEAILSLTQHFLNHYYSFRVGDYPQVY